METQTVTTLENRLVRLETNLETHISNEELILKSLLSGITDINATLVQIRIDLATQVESQKAVNARIGRLEKASGAITITFMAALLAVFLSGCSLFSGLKPAAPAQPEPPKIDVVARAVNNTVALLTETNDVFCSGVVAEGTIYTAAHCVPDGQVFKVWYKQQSFPGVRVSVNQVEDLAIVAAIGVRIRDSVPFAETMPKLGNKVIWMGYPLGEDFIMGTGIVANPSVKAATTEARWMAIYGQFIPGNSGGPVFNYKGELIGIISSTMYHPAFGLLPVGYAVPLNVLRATL